MNISVDLVTKQDSGVYGTLDIKDTGAFDLTLNDVESGRRVGSTGNIDRVSLAEEITWAFKVLRSTEGGN